MKKGDIVHIMITGVLGDYLAKVVDFDCPGYPVLKVTSDPSWAHLTLRNGDYIIL